MSRLSFHQDQAIGLVSGVVDVVLAMAIVDGRPDTALAAFGSPGTQTSAPLT